MELPDEAALAAELAIRSARRFRLAALLGFLTGAALLASFLRVRPEDPNDTYWLWIAIGLYWLAIYPAATSWRMSRALRAYRGNRAVNDGGPSHPLE